MNKQERNEKIELYGRGFELLKAALAGVPPDAMKCGWSTWHLVPRSSKRWLAPST